MPLCYIKLSIFSRKIRLGLKVTTRRALISQDTPVLGFRPGLATLSRRVKFPKLDNLTFSPDASVSRIVSNRLFTRSRLSLCVKPIASVNAWAISAFVTVIFLSSPYSMRVVLFSVFSSGGGGRPYVRGHPESSPVTHPESPSSWFCVYLSWSG